MSRKRITRARKKRKAKTLAEKLRSLETETRRESQISKAGKKSAKKKLFEALTVEHVSRKVRDRLLRNLDLPGGYTPPPPPGKNRKARGFLK
jgi:hypothetical protein